MSLKKIVILFLLFICLFVWPKKTEALRYSLIAPSGTLERGQDIQFTININTEGTTVTTQQIGLTYETQYLQYVSTTPGTAMNSVIVADQGGGKLLFTGTSTNGFSGTDSFAIVTLKIIAQSSGSSQLCTLWAPTPTATPAPTGIPLPQPTALPRTGSFNKMFGISALAFTFVLGAIGIYYLNQESKYEKPKRKKVLNSKH